MRIVNVIQGSEAWEKLRCGLPTASRFDSIVTPAKCKLSSSWKSYAAELIAQEMGLIVQPPPSFWMDHGMEMEPKAIAAYEKITGVQTQVIGFAFPDDHGRYGCSPDRLVGEDGLLEVKCPKPETLIQYHANGEFPAEYKPQVQGQLFITGRSWCDFMAYHPDMKPFLVRVESDLEYQAKLAIALEEFCDLLDELRSRLSDIDQAVEVQLNDDYQPIIYEPSEVEI